MPTIEDGKQAVAEGNPQQARLIFEAILQETPRSEDAWLGLAEVLTENEDKRVCYENVLKINKNNRQAKEGLRNLEPQSNPFVDALRPPSAETETVEAEDDDEEDDDDETMVATRAPAFDDSYESDSDGPQLFMLVAMGLGLSVVVFAAGSGLVYYVLTTLTAP